MLTRDLPLLNEISISCCIPQQVDHSRNECDDLNRELRKKEQEVEKVHQEKIIELEKVPYILHTRLPMCMKQKGL